MNQNKRVIHILVVMSVLFLSIIGYLSYFELFMKEDIITNNFNKRQTEYARETLRGSIYDRDGEILAASEGEIQNQKRVYPFENLYSQVIGYNSVIYGNSLLESVYNQELIGKNALSSILDIKDQLSGDDKKGNNLLLTIDHDLQKKASELLGDRKGAVVAIDPKTGEILAMVSKPDYDPNSSNLEENWSKLVESQDSPFLPRAIQGIYVPGSTYKIVTSVAAYENGLVKEGYDDQGSVVIDGKFISNFGEKAYGKIDFSKALAVSSNAVFAQTGVDLGFENLKEVALQFGFNKKLPFDLSVKKSSFPYTSMKKTDMAAVGIGQGSLQVTPLHMAMITASLANDGTMMEPYLVKGISTSKGKVIYSKKPSVFLTVTDKSTADQVTGMMIKVVEEGTGTRARISGINVAGKTGTAENELTSSQGDKEHAWFVGFAPAEDPQIAIAVILEYSGSTGGKTAAPIAKEIMEAYLK
ncbi:MAG: peptidoglycan glycosyltransferase [Eubacteriaceae bacterium]|nr:peptidoglycan glycosyltransferase [Eubacteriaceae bacterium]